MILGICLTVSALPASACWHEAAARYGVDPQLLCGLAKVESSFNSRAENRSHIQKTKSTDIGELQVNSRWLKKLAKYGITREDLFDSCVSRNIGAWIISDLLHRMGDTWEAVGAYNAACTNLTPEECREARSEYAWKVYRAMNSRACQSLGQS